MIFLTDWAVDDVKTLQRALKSIGYRLGHTGPEKDGIDGSKGPITTHALENFCKVHHFDPEGLDFSTTVRNETTAQFYEIIDEVHKHQAAISDVKPTTHTSHAHAAATHPHVISPAEKAAKNAAKAAAKAAAAEEKKVVDAYFNARSVTDTHPRPGHGLNALSLEYSKLLQERMVKAHWLLPEQATGHWNKASTKAVEIMLNEFEVETAMGFPAWQYSYMKPSFFMDNPNGKDNDTEAACECVTDAFVKPPLDKARRPYPMIELVLKIASNAGSLYDRRDIDPLLAHTASKLHPKAPVKKSETFDALLQHHGVSKQHLDAKEVNGQGHTPAGGRTSATKAATRE